MKKNLPIQIILATACLTTLLGCGSVTKVSKLDSAINPALSSDSVVLLKNSVISIQYPMLSSEAAKQQLAKEYPCKQSYVYGYFDDGGCGHPDFTGDFAPMLFEQSTYQAAELKKLLSKKINEKNIYLEPTYVDYVNGKFTSKPLFLSTIPTSLVVDIYDFPHVVRQSIGGESYITASIRSAGKTSPATCGNLFVTGKHFGFQKNNPAPCVELDSRNTFNFSPLQYFSESKTIFVDFPKHEGKPIAVNSVLTTGALTEEKDDNYLKRTADPKFKVATDNINNPPLDWLARATVNALQRIDTQVAFDAGFAVYLQDYDEGLANRFRQRTVLPGDARKIAVARKLLDAESDWLASQNAAITDGILNGNYGRSFREARWVLAQGYNKSQALAWMQVGAVLAAGFSSGLFGGAGAYNPSMLMTQLVKTDQQFSSMQDQIEQALLNNLAPGTEMRSKVVQVSIDGVQASLSGATHGEFRAQLLALYKKLAGA